ncbi:hypothetical protein BDQ17DRAFT_1381230 [Cyathus striatus]|nr:hypothetical protein BDQ17DRAFT_1381230 [Cyathus striatus]
MMLLFTLLPFSLLLLTSNAHEDKSTLTNFQPRDTINRTEPVCACPTGYFACPTGYGAKCCPDDSFCGTVGGDFVCYT